MASLQPEIGVCDKQNFSVYTEDEGKIMNVGEPEAIENEPSINKPDNTPQLDQDSPPQPQTESTNSLKFGKYNERIPLFGECNSDPAEAEGSKTAFSSPKRASRRLNRRITQPSMDTTPIYYEMVPRIADSSWPLPPFPACSGDLSPISPQSIGRQSKDSTSRNYGRAPLIRDLFVADSARPLPSVNEDTYGGGIKISRETTTQNYGKAPLIHDSFVANSALPLPSINENVSGRWSSDPSQAEGYTIALPTAQRTSLAIKSECHHTDLPIRDTAFLNYGKAPLIEDSFADSARPLPSVNGKC